MNTNPDNDTELRIKINRETARLPWAELERHFAQGTVVFVSPDLDLIDVAVRISHDDKDSIARWMADSRVGKVTVEQAQAWSEGQAVLWTAVVSPFVLVQAEKAKLN
ncbi:DUF2288 domain-containing protein [Massilia psychrophila]|jgi:hypothetical protein|uniref:DUF2288 domain-containing protein n=1 Tax=Massilia psychrophila TaxID=1603353 RepID=A0A2G8T4A2_9BURK|nr:DUF2288 domain-containing protein [Massilia psychrophila]PIL40832.1 hypothetical protein CR103_05105 [Massilia psychrophila]GGE73020.1 hypothetical protein GCM10008020_17100 [Massilia psychrophila]